MGYSVIEANLLHNTPARGLTKQKKMRYAVTTVTERLTLLFIGSLCTQLAPRWQRYASTISVGAANSDIRNCIVFVNSVCLQTAVSDAQLTHSFAQLLPSSTTRDY